ncbi:MAG: hypothetical protein R2809_10970 [Flavobacteriales bacterium]
MIKMIEVNRHISIYEKDGDKYIGEIPLTNVALKDLQSLVSIEKYKDDHLLYNCYLLDKSMLDKLAVLDNQTFNLNLDSHEYFLEATTK